MRPLRKWLKLNGVLTVGPRSNVNVSLIRRETKGDVFQLISCLPSMHEVLGSIPAPHPWLHSELEDSLGTVIPCLKKQNEKPTKRGVVAIWRQKECHKFEAALIYLVCYEAAWPRVRPWVSYHLSSLKERPCGYAVKRPLSAHRKRALTIC